MKYAVARSGGLMRTRCPPSLSNTTCAMPRRYRPGAPAGQHGPVLAGIMGPDAPGGGNKDEARQGRYDYVNR